MTNEHFLVVSYFLVAFVSLGLSVLVYPVAGTDMTTRSYKENERAIPLSKQAMAWFVDNTVRSPADVNDPRLNIVGRANLRGLPPVFSSLRVTRPRS